MVDDWEDISLYPRLSDCALVDLECRPSVDHLDHAEFFAAPGARRTSVQRLPGHARVIVCDPVQEAFDQPASTAFEILAHQKPALALDLDDAPV